MKWSKVKSKQTWSWCPIQTGEKWLTLQHTLHWTTVAILCMMWQPIVLWPIFREMIHLRLKEAKQRANTDRAWIQHPYGGRPTHITLQLMLDHCCLYTLWPFITHIIPYHCCFLVCIEQHQWMQEKQLFESWLYSNLHVEIWSLFGVGCKQLWLRTGAVDVAKLRWKNYSTEWST